MTQNTKFDLKKFATLINVKFDHVRAPQLLYPDDISLLIWFLWYNSVFFTVQVEDVGVK